MEILFRTESYSGDGIRSARDIIAFEIGELNNADILATLFGDGMLADMPIAGKMRRLIDEIDREGFIDDMSDEDFLALADEILAAVKQKTGVDVQYALWLCDREAIATHYGQDMADAYDYSAYETGPVVLSDLGTDGKLFGYTNMPEALNVELEPIKFVGGFQMRRT